MPLVGVFLWSLLLPGFVDRVEGVAAAGDQTEEALPYCGGGWKECKSSFLDNTRVVGVSGSVSVLIMVNCFLLY